MPTAGWTQDKITVEFQGEDSDSSSNTTTFNLAQCQASVNGNLKFRVGFLLESFPLTDDPQYSVKIEVNNNCQSDSLEVGSAEPDCVLLSSTPKSIPATSGSDGTGSTRYFDDIEVPFAQVFPEITSASECEDTNIESAILVIGESKTVDEATGNTVTSTLDKAHEISVLTQRPAISPPSVSITAGESILSLTFTPDPDAENYNVYFSDTAVSAGTTPESLIDNGGQVLGSVGSSGQTVDIASLGLESGQSYHISLAALDIAGNESLLGDSTSFIAVLAQGYPEQYVGAGGQEEGGFIFGCHVSATHGPFSLGGAVFFLILLLVFFGLKRRSRKRDRKHRSTTTTLVGGIAVLLFPMANTADAQDLDQLETSGVFEIKVGGYLPNIDGEFEGKGVNGAADPTPYGSVFSGEDLTLFELEIDKQIYRGVGTFGFGFSAGFMEAEGNEVLDNGQNSIDSATFNIIIARLSAIYRFDVLAVEYDIPFVPVAKLGLDYYFWRAKNSKGDVEELRAENYTSQGDTLGWHFSLGMNLLLDWFDESSADTLFVDYGLANTYLFAEWVYSDVNDFGSDKSHDLSDPSGYLVGLAFEY
jgi:hypothetical protein